MGETEPCKGFEAVSPSQVTLSLSKCDLCPVYGFQVRANSIRFFSAGWS
jgi:hypothetical protein